MPPEVSHSLCDMLRMSIILFTNVWSCKRIHDGSGSFNYPPHTFYHLKVKRAK